MVNRKKGPFIHAIDQITIPPIAQYLLPNGIQVCEVNLGSQEILKMEIVHLAGRSVEDHHLISRATSSLLKDGCGSKSSAQIAEHIDFYGSSIKTASNMDFSYTTLHTLTKRFENLIPLLSEMYYQPTFPEEEIEKFKKINIQKLKEELTKNDIISYRQITESIFGINHPYGYNSVETDYLAITREKIQKHLSDYYGSDNAFIFLSGKINDSVRNAVSKHFGNIRHESKKKTIIQSDTQIERNILSMTSKNEHQSSIKLGRRLFDKHHPDNAAFFVLNTILGGYFGSRLMNSIREEKGYTYDINSSIDQMLYDGCFYVSTEAAPEYVEPILENIYIEMNQLQDEKVEKEELTMVKNYLMGNFMNMLDGPMNVSSFAKSMILTGQKPDEFYQYIDEIKSIDASQIQEMAQKYLNTNDMLEVIVRPEN